HPNFDPVAFRLGPLAVHWYGLMYLIGFWGCWWIGTRRARQPHIQWTEQQLSDLVFYVIMGVILGGRVGYTLFYNLPNFLHDTPLDYLRWLAKIFYDWHGFATTVPVIFRLWEGGMSFHGGLLGVVIAYLLLARKLKMHPFDIGDFAAPLIPFGLFTGRIGNFINGELWGAPTTLPWGMVFQHAGPEPRHPTMLYEAGLEGLAMLGILWWFGRQPRPRMAVAALFILLYALFRTMVEFVRLPDAQIGYLFGTGWITMGMTLCVPMWIAGAIIMFLAYRRPVYTPAAQRVLDAQQKGAA
ncbi:MAG TPA: prolipoprotein diacylglyceryl transferase, partial [Nevskiaceae bacterium]|nr:prolipoprotein diacylglyceryl transferase [Nevskiaceae bacterium]